MVRVPAFLDILPCFILVLFTEIVIHEFLVKEFASLSPCSPEDYKILDQHYHDGQKKPPIIVSYGEHFPLLLFNQISVAPIVFLLKLLLVNFFRVLFLFMLSRNEA